MARLMTTYALVAVALALAPYVAASTPYSVSTADYMIDFCAAAYCPEDKIQSWDCVTCKLHPQVTDISIMRKYVAAFVLPVRCRHGVAGV